MAIPGTIKTDPALLERLKAAVDARDAMSPLERAIHDTRQKRSLMIGLSDFDRPDGEIEALIDKMPEFVILAELDRLSTREGEIIEAKDNAYSERDQLVCALSKQFPAWLERHPDSDLAWEDDWRWIVFIEIPVRTYKLFGDQRLGRSRKDIFEDNPQQVSWHIHDSELPWFSHLERRTGNSWDGHTTPEKYRRLAAISLQEKDAK